MYFSLGLGRSESDGEQAGSGDPVPQLHPAFSPAVIPGRGGARAGGGAGSGSSPGGGVRAALQEHRRAVNAV